MATGQSSYSSTSGTTYYDLTTDTGDRAEINDALFFQNKPDSSSGTGLIQAIVRVQDPGGGDGFELGYNTSFRPLSYEENTSPNFTTSLLLSEVPIVTIDGQQYYEFRLDINQLNGDGSLLSLDEIKLYSSAVGDGLAQGTIGGAWFAANADLVYDMDGAGNTSVLLDAANSSGSGSSDMFFYVPVSNFGAVDPDDTYVTLYSEFGAANVLDGSDGLTPLNDPANTALADNGDDTGDVATAIYGTYTANDGFEEWSVSKSTGGAISGYKFDDANGNGQWDDGEEGLGGWTFDYTLTYDEGKGHNIQHVVVDGTVTTSDGTMDVNGDGVIDPAGFYSILVPASADKNETYTITLTEHAQAGWVNTYDGDATANGTTTFTFTKADLTTSGDPASPNISGHFETTETMNFGNRALVPNVTITKDASVDGDCADTVGELITYTITVDNDGELDLTNVVVKDNFEGGGDVTLVVTGDGGDGLDPGEVVLTGDDGDGILETGETWTYTFVRAVTQDMIDDNGGGDGSLDNTATVNADSTNGSVTDNDDATVEVCQNPHITVAKDATVDGDCADVAGELVNYTIDVTNDGNVTLDTVVVTDTLADSGSIAAVDLDNDTFNDGDTNANGKLDVGETWLYTAYHTVTQDEIDAGGNYDSSDPADGINDSLRNVATATAEVVDSDTQVTDDDDAVVEVCQNPGIDLEKYVTVDPTTVPPDAADSSWDDADGALGPQNVNLGTDVWFKVTVENTGNVTLTDVDINDNNTTTGLPGTFFDLVVDGELTADAINNHGATLDGDTDGDHYLDVGETWTIIYSQAFDAGEHVNTATVTTAEGPTDDDPAHYFSLVDEGLCPRTPGFWQNPNNGAQFWDGIQGNEKHAGESGFPDGELLYAVDSDHDGDIDGNDQKGFLIGDYDHDGLTGAGEDTLFVSFADAQTLINASNKQLNGSSGDGRFMLGRDMVASWLNYLQGSGFGDASDPQSPHHYLDDAIDWMQIYSGKTNGGTNEIFDTLKLTGGAIKTNTSIWKDVQSGFDHSAGQMHGALDYYNNTGQTEQGGTHYANCESQHLFEALSIYQQSHELV